MRFDAIWNWVNNKVGIVVAICDHMGEFYAGLSKTDIKATSAEVADGGYVEGN